MTYIENPMIRWKENSGHCHDVVVQEYSRTGINKKTWM